MEIDPPPMIEDPDFGNGTGSPGKNRTGVYAGPPTQIAQGQIPPTMPRSSWNRSWPERFAVQRSSGPGRAQRRQATTLLLGPPNSRRGPARGPEAQPGLASAGVPAGAGIQGRAPRARTGHAHAEPPSDQPACLMDPFSSSGTGQDRRRLLVPRRNVLSTGYGLFYVSHRKAVRPQVCLRVDSRSGRGRADPRPPLPQRGVTNEANGQVGGPVSTDNVFARTICAQRRISTTETGAGRQGR